MSSLAWAKIENYRLDDSITMLNQIVDLSIDDRPDPRYSDPHATDSTVNRWRHNSLYSLASAYKCIGELEKAIPILEQVLEMRKLQLGPDHPDTLNCMGELGTVFLKSGKLETALPLLEQTVELQIARFGQHNPDAIFSMGLLGEAYVEAGRHEDAVSMLIDTVKLATIRGRLAQHDGSCRAFGRRVPEIGPREEAVTLLEQMIEQCGDDFLYLLFTRNTLASTHLQLEAWDDAERLLRQNLEMCGRSSPYRVWAKYYAMSMLGEALMNQREYDAALPCLLDGYDRLVKYRKADPFLSLTDRDGFSIIGYDYSECESRVEEALQRLIQFFEAWHNDEPDAGHDLEAQLVGEEAASRTRFLWKFS